MILYFLLLVTPIGGCYWSFIAIHKSWNCNCERLLRLEGMSLSVFLLFLSIFYVKCSVNIYSYFISVSISIFLSIYLSIYQPIYIYIYIIYIYMYMYITKTSTNVKIDPKSLWLIVSILFPHWFKILRPYLVPVPNYWTWTKSTPQKKEKVFLVKSL